MPKLRNRGRARGDAKPASVDSAVSELGALADSDRGTVRDSYPTEVEREEAALPAQREVYERITGRRTGPRKDSVQRDVRARLEDDEEDEDEEREQPSNYRRPSVDDDEDEDPVDDEDEGGAPPISKKQLDKARNALRRANAPAWVYDEDPERIVELAGSFAGYQSHADRALQSKDETIRALSAAVGARGNRASADDESPGNETPPEEDLVRAAEGLARSMGVEGDESSKKALIDYAKAIRKGGLSPTASERSEIERLQSVVREMAFDQGIRGIRRLYPDHLSDRSEVTKLKKRVALLSQDESFADDIPGLFQEAARGLWGESQRSSGRARASKGGAPVTVSRHERRESRPVGQGTEEHDRAVYSRIMGKSRARLATRR